MSGNKYPYLREDEAVKDSIELQHYWLFNFPMTRMRLIATDNRLVIIRNKIHLGGGTELMDDFEYRYIAHIGTNEKNYRIFAWIFAVLGLIGFVLPLLGWRYYWYIPFGGFLIIAGPWLLVISIILFILSSSIFMINISGIPKPYSYPFKGPTSRNRVSKFISVIREAREKL